MNTKLRNPKTVKMKQNDVKINLEKTGTKTQHTYICIHMVMYICIRMYILYIYLYIKIGSSVVFLVQGQHIHLSTSLENTLAESYFHIFLIH